MKNPKIFLNPAIQKKVVYTELTFTKPSLELNITNPSRIKGALSWSVGKSKIQQVNGDGKPIFWS